MSKQVLLFLFYFPTFKEEKNSDPKFLRTGFSIKQESGARSIELIKNRWGMLSGVLSTLALWMRQNWGKIRRKKINYNPIVIFLLFTASFTQMSRECEHYDTLYFFKVFQKLEVLLAFSESDNTLYSWPNCPVITVIKCEKKNCFKYFTE